jgi:hypothetical protein
MDITDLATPNGAAIDLSEVGDTIEGVLVKAGGEVEIWVPIDTKFGTKLKCPFSLKVGDEDRTLWVTKGSRLATVIGNAFKEAGQTTITVGGVLKVRRVADVPTNKGNPMFDFQAKYTPPAGVGPELEDF